MALTRRGVRSKKRDEIHLMIISDAYTLRDTLEGGKAGLI